MGVKQQTSYEVLVFDGVATRAVRNRYGIGTTPFSEYHSHDAFRPQPGAAGVSLTVG
jgi:hypothetical protein